MLGFKAAKCSPNVNFVYNMRVWQMTDAFVA